MNGKQVCKCILYLAVLVFAHSSLTPVSASQAGDNHSRFRGEDFTITLPDGIHASTATEALQGFTSDDGKVTCTVRVLDEAQDVQALRSLSGVSSDQVEGFMAQYVAANMPDGFRVKRFDLDERSEKGDSLYLSGDMVGGNDEFSSIVPAVSVVKSDGKVGVFSLCMGYAQQLNERKQSLKEMLRSIRLVQQ